MEHQKLQQGLLEVHQTFRMRSLNYSVTNSSLLLRSSTSLQINSDMHQSMLEISAKAQRKARSGSAELFLLWESLMYVQTDLR